MTPERAPKFGEMTPESRVVKLRIRAYPENWKNEIPWKSENLNQNGNLQNFLKISKLKSKMEISKISWKSQNWNQKWKFPKFLENLKKVW